MINFLKIIRNYYNKMIKVKEVRSIIIINNSNNNLQLVVIE